MTGASKEQMMRSGGPSMLSILYSVTKKVGTVAIVYLMGYYNISVAWLIGPVILSVVRDEWKRSSEARRSLAKAVAMTNEREVILSRLDELPAWVFFPDVERAEWLNRIIVQLWPKANAYAQDLLKTIVEPNVRDALAAYKLPGFKFGKMILGTIPFRVGGVKVYDHNISRSEIIMDIDFFYAGDCDISFLLAGISGGVKDFQIHGMLRVVMKPLIPTMPLIGGLQVFFLNNPTIDFNLVGAIDVLDMPGLSDILRCIIIEQIAAFMVLPNKLPIHLSDHVPAQVLKTPEPEGVLRIHVVEAKDLMKMDIGMLGKGKSDPYAIISVGAQQFRTHTIDNTVNPKWDFWCESEVFAPRVQTLHVRILDKDDSKKDERLGRATVEISSVVKKGELDIWLALEEVKHGMVHLRLSWHTLTDDASALSVALAETQRLRVTSMSTALLVIFIDCAKKLPNARPDRRPDPFITMGVGKNLQSTTVVHRTDDPVWEQGFTFLVSNPETDTLTMRVTDHKTNLDIGRLEYHLAQLLSKDNLEIQEEPFRLQKSGPTSRIHMSIKLKILKRYNPDVDGPLPSTEGEDDIESVVEDSFEETSGKVSESAPVSKPMVRGDSVRSESGKSIGGVSNVSSSKDKLITQPSVQEEPPTTDMPSADLDSHSLLHRTPSVTSSAGEAGLGRILLTLRYAEGRQRLIVLVQKVANLPLKDPSSIPDPYVKLYLLPERSKDSKRKTDVIKDNCNPSFNETFEYVISRGELNSRQLEVSVVTKRTWMSSQNPVMGQVILNLGEMNLAKGLAAWYDLQPPQERDA